MEVSLTGTAAKGPFILGSSVTVSSVDVLGEPTGQTFSTMTLSDQGEFSLALFVEPQLAVETTGFYWVESTGELSDAPLTLRALAERGEGSSQTVNVNLVTHLTAGRVKTLLGQGLSWSEAITQAEAELRPQFQFIGSAVVLEKTGSGMSLVTGDDPSNAYLFAVSCVLSEAARVRSESSGSLEANLQELINTMADTMASTGQIAPALKEELASVALTLDMAVLEQRFEARLLEVESDAAVPDLDSVMDQDADGLVNAEDNCDKVANATQDDQDTDGVGDACDNCVDVSNVDQSDLDGNGAGDACDPCPQGDDERCPCDPALEGYGCDAGEVCRLVSVPATSTSPTCVGAGTMPEPNDGADYICSQPGEGALFEPCSGVVDGVTCGAGLACAWAPRNVLIQPPWWGTFDPIFFELDPMGETRCLVDCASGGQCSAGFECTPVAGGCTSSFGEQPGEVCRPNVSASPVPDYCTSGMAPDTDGDGVNEWCDNCLTQPNPGQEDGDGDGLGDACLCDPASPTCTDGMTCQPFPMEGGWGFIGEKWHALAGKGMCLPPGPYQLGAVCDGDPMGGGFPLICDVGLLCDGASPMYVCREDCSATDLCSDPTLTCQPLQTEHGDPEPWAPGFKVCR